MPIDIVSSMIFDGPETVPGWRYIKTVVPALMAIGVTKYYFGGNSNKFERDLHGKVYIITGGTSGLGARLAYELGCKGAQIILLVRSIEDQWTIDFIEDLRDKTGNFMIYGEQCDLSSLYSVRKFATKWLDNQPPRRLDGVICLAAETLPASKTIQITDEGIERQMAINYFGHYHLLTLLNPSLRVQPPDRDVQVIVATCSSQSLGEVDLQDLMGLTKSNFKNFANSKLLLGLFVKQFQIEHDSYERKDKFPCNIKVNVVNPGLMSSPSTRRFLSNGSILGLMIYMVLYPIWWIFLKSSLQGCQSILFVLLAPIIRKVSGGNYIQECKIITNTRKEYHDEQLIRQLFTNTGKVIDEVEKKSAITRKLREKQEKQQGKHKPNDDLTKKPENEQELQSKLDKIRQNLNISTQKLPLFPDQTNEKNAK